jgi:hypothetical protein
MCFSASASIGAGVVLSVIGVASIKKAHSKQQLYFASIPIVFAVQQFSEGLLWVALAEPINISLRHNMTIIFLFFAQVVWPILVPVAILKMEPKANRRLAGKVFVGIGALVSSYLFYCLMAFQVDASALGKHIIYEQYYPISVGKSCGILYVLATIGPPFISRLPRMWMLGITILISYIITSFFYTDYIVSVWCFFASIISIAVYAVLQDNTISSSLITDSDTNRIVI